MVRWALWAFDILTFFKVFGDCYGAGRRAGLEIMPKALGLNDACCSDEIADGQQDLHQFKLAHFCREAQCRAACVAWIDAQDNARDPLRAIGLDRGGAGAALDAFD